MGSEQHEGEPHLTPALGWASPFVFDVHLGGCHYGGRAGETYSLLCSPTVGAGEMEPSQLGMKKPPNSQHSIPGSAVCHHTYW